MKHFKYSEFDQKGLSGSGQMYMNEYFLALMDSLRERCGFPIIITSGYRSPTYNNKVSTTGLNGPHTTGKAADIKVFGEQAHMILREATELGFSGIGISQKGDHEERFIHLDTLEDGENGAPRRWVWSYG